MTAGATGASGADEESSDFLAGLRRRAAARLRTIVYPEGPESRTLDAVAECALTGLVDPVVLGAPDAVAAGLGERGVPPEAVEIRDPSDPVIVRRTLERLRERRAGRHDDEDRLRTMATDPLMQAGIMVADGDAHGAVAGSERTTADVIRAGLTCIGLAEGIRTLSSSFYMVFGPDHPVGPCVLTFTDAGVVPRPSARQLSEIATAAADARSRIVGDEPRVAFLSYSTLGSANGPPIDLVREALDRFRTRRPDVVADGELQADAALSPRVAERKAPGSPIGGSANVLVFPDLAAANIGYKLVQYLGGAVALGPVVHGLAKPFNDLSRGAIASDIVEVSCITALMAD